MAKEVLSVTLDPELIVQLKQLAQEQNRTISNLVETLLMRALNE